MVRRKEGDSQDQPGKRTDQIKKKQNIIISCLVTPEDAERIKQAFEEGKLASLGIKSFNIVSETDHQSPSNKQWSKTEIEKREAPRDDKTPPSPR